MTSISLSDLFTIIFVLVGDWYYWNYYISSPPNNTLGPETGDFKVQSGGGWHDDVYHMRTAFRRGDGPGASYGLIDFFESLKYYIKLVII